MTTSKGYRNRSRKLLTKSPRTRGMPSPSAMLREFSEGDKVVVDIEPSVHKGMPHRRFQGRVGTVIEKRGRGYVVSVPTENANGIITVRPIHLKPFTGG
ncbi:MAG: 50S ribosomal protein L21e [Thermoprotei archaeon]